MLVKLPPFAGVLSLLALLGAVGCGGNPDLVVPDHGVDGSGGDGGQADGTGAKGPGIQVGGQTGEGNEGGGFTCDASDPDCQTEQPGCGDGLLEPTSEVCDDGNSVPGDGCSGICTVEPNFDCPPTGGPCVTNIVCGDGQLGGGEVCDDGNDSDGDGCAADCQSIEPDFDCSQPGEPCVDLVVCGDGDVTGDEGCDDKGAPDDGDNLNGYGKCAPGCKFGPRCGDGKLQKAYGEECDDGNTRNGDNCSSVCKKPTGPK